jgi:hypothetical protein
MPMWYVGAKIAAQWARWVANPHSLSNQAPNCHRQQLYQVIWGRKEYAAFFFLVLAQYLVNDVGGKGGGNLSNPCSLISDPSVWSLLGWRFLGYLKQPPSRGVPCE